MQRPEMRTAAEHRGMRDTIERRWSDTVARAERLPEPASHPRIDDEWSFVETLRHPVFITDAWAGRTVLDEPMPYHRLGAIQYAYAPLEAAALGIGIAATPRGTARAARRSRHRGPFGRVTWGRSALAAS